MISIIIIMILMMMMMMTMMTSYQSQTSGEVDVFVHSQSFANHVVLLGLGLG
jgi:hypothetical protein